MRVLYVLAHFPQGSESYVEAEIAYISRFGRGVEISVWAPVFGYGDPPTVPVLRGSLAEALAVVRPHVVHVHHMTTASSHLEQLFAFLPDGKTTIRAHSFDWNDSLVRKLVAHPSVGRIFAFPHLAAKAEGASKVVPLPVAYDPDLYVRTPKDRRAVVRLSAGLPTKSLGDFLEVGNRIPEADFTLAVNLVPGGERFFEDIVKANRHFGGRVRILKNLPRLAARDLTATAGIYFGTHDPSKHPFGMPISIAEAMATGSIVLARKAYGVDEFLGEARLTYRSVDEAENKIRSVLGLSGDDWSLAEELSCRSAERFRSGVVLPALLKEWDSICSDNFKG